MFDVRMNQMVKSRDKLYVGGVSIYDNKAKELAALLVQELAMFCLLKALNDSLSNGSSVLDIFQQLGILSDARVLKVLFQIPAAMTSLSHGRLKVLPPSWDFQFSCEPWE